MFKQTHKYWNTQTEVNYFLHTYMCRDRQAYIYIYIYIRPCMQNTDVDTVLFPTCQVRVVRFYQSWSSSSSPPPPPPPPPPPLVSPRPCLHQLPPPFPPCQLFAKLFANSLRQALCQLPSSVCTAGPQPGTFPAQCALLDLNLVFFQLSVRCWTSTRDLPSSVRTAGPQPGAAQLSVHRWTSTARKNARRYAR